MTTTTRMEVMRELGLAQVLLAGNGVILESSNWLQAIVKLAADPTRAAELRAVLDIAQQLASCQSLTTDHQLLTTDHLQAANAVA